MSIACTYCEHLHVVCHICTCSMCEYMCIVACVLVGPALNTVQSTAYSEAVYLKICRPSY